MACLGIAISLLIDIFNRVFLKRCSHLLRDIITDREPRCVSSWFWHLGIVPRLNLLNPYWSSSAVGWSLGRNCPRCILQSSVKNVYMMCSLIGTGSDFVSQTAAVWRHAVGCLPGPAAVQRWRRDNYRARLIKVVSRLDGQGGRSNIAGYEVDNTAATSLRPAVTGYIR